MRIKFAPVVLLFLLVILSGCPKTTVEDTNNGDVSGDGTTDCGVVVDGKLENPVSLADGIPVQVDEITGPDQLSYIVVNDIDREKKLLKLQGLGAAQPTFRTQAIDYLRSSTYGTLYLYLAKDSCTTVVDGGGKADVGTLVDSTGKSINEIMARTGLVNVDASSVCNTELINGCYAGLKDSDPITEGDIGSFLWKPASDNDGRLAVHTGPYGTTVIVNGEVGQNSGGGNGYGSLARFSKSGCAYGNPQIRVLSANGLPYTVGGKATFTVANPCGRNCLEGQEIVACVKN